MTITWSVVNGGGTIDSITGEFTASDQPGTYTDTIQVQVTIDGQTEIGYASVVIERQTPEVPILLFPPDGTITTTSAITLAWQADAGKTPDGYQVKLDGETITTTATTSPTNLALGIHTWTVRAYNAAGYSEWATPRTIEVTQTLPPPSTPMLLYPTDGLITADQSVTLTWQAGNGAAPAGYRVELDGSVITTTSTMSSTRLSVDTHTWRVQAYNASGDSDWTDLWSFEITETVPLPITPTLLFPPDGLITTTQTLDFQWVAGKGAAPTGYNVDLDGAVITRTSTSWSKSLSLGLHNWRVRAYNEAGYSDWTAAWSIEITKPVVLSTPILLAPPNNTITTTQAVTLAWQAGDGPAPDGYNLDVDGEILTTTGTTSPTLLTYGVHTWTVRAYNEHGKSAWAEPWEIEISRSYLYLPLILKNP